MKRILVASDFHGNSSHLEALQERVAAGGVDAVVFAGDLSPSKLLYPTPQLADEYLREHVFPSLCQFKCPTYVLAGNTDFWANSERYLQEFTDPVSQFKFVVADVVSVLGVDVLMYGYVHHNPTPLKDGIKADTATSVTEAGSRRGVVSRVGVSSHPPLGDPSHPMLPRTSVYPMSALSFQEVDLSDPSTLPDWKRQQLGTTIEDDLVSLRDKHATPPLLWVTHDAPYDTVADRAWNWTMTESTHRGSEGMRNALEGPRHPAALVCGHFHQSCHQGEEEETLESGTRVCTISNEGLLEASGARQCSMVEVDIDPEARDGRGAVTGMRRVVTEVAFPPDLARSEEVYQGYMAEWNQIRRQKK
ncbi:hypothetical protein KIPB_007994 [Kipferlia bialata]|uniref:Calcineurin-like phosphoesterase domain-containing protein n=1 Tax=Kipferlia bialata TaxID=797122 RepID=A0A9K3GL36_9EUKA|nr:hypothetical protein KIPB_007994 [Kipferlia bialata]|eukprot:g7994.t1